MKTSPRFEEVPLLLNTKFPTEYEIKFASEQFSIIQPALCTIYLQIYKLLINRLAPNDVYISRTAQLTSRRCILNIYSINIITEYFKHAAHSPFFSLQDAVYFIMLSFLVPVIFTF